MIPLALSPSLPGLALAGTGDAALRRLRALRAAGGNHIRVYAPAPTAALAAAAGEQLVPHLPGAADWPDIRVLWVAGLAPEAAAALATAARAARVLVNVEDLPEYCDFYAMAEIRRGDLLVALSTGGAAPGLAAALRRQLEACFPAAWGERVHEVTALRKIWREEGLSMAEIAARIDALVKERCWLSCPTISP
jgi:precorrin-2 dehydrogenase/sirohydrochlorin ferrochelatase